MNRRILSLIAFVFITLCVTGKDLTRYRVWLTDKAENAYSIEQPKEFLSTKAIERRAKRNIEITEQDLPVSNVYLQQIKDRMKRKYCSRFHLVHIHLFRCSQ